MIIFAAEPYARWFREAGPLQQAHHAETDPSQEWPLNIDHGEVLTLEAAGRLSAFTARQDGRLVGYAVWLVGPQVLHFDAPFVGECAAVYLAPEVRHGRAGADLLAWCEDHLPGHVGLIRYRVSPRRDWSPILRRRGFRPAEQVWERACLR